MSAFDPEIKDIDHNRARALSAHRRRVVRTGFIQAFFAWGLGFYGPSIYLQIAPAQAELSLGTISAAVSMHFLISAATVWVLPELHRIVGLRRCTLAGIVLAALGAVVWTLVSSVPHAVLAAILSGVGWGLTGAAAIIALISRHHDSDRPQALALVFTGASLAGVIWPTVWTVLFASFDHATIAVGVGLAQVVVVGLAVLSAAEGRRDVQSSARSRPELFKLRGAWSLMLSFFLGMTVQAGVMLHLLSMLKPVHGAVVAAGAQSLTMLAALLGRYVVAWVMTLRNRRRVTGAVFLLQAVGFGLVLNDGYGWDLLAGCCFVGVGLGGFLTLPALIAQTEFAPSIAEALVARVSAVNQFGFVCGPMLIGLSHDLTQSYTPALIAASAVSVLAAAIVQIRSHSKA